MTDQGSIAIKLGMFIMVAATGIIAVLNGVSLLRSLVDNPTEEMQVDQAVDGVGSSILELVLFLLIVGCLVVYIKIKMNARKRRAMLEAEILDDLEQLYDDVQKNCATVNDADEDDKDFDNDVYERAFRQSASTASIENKY